MSDASWNGLREHLPAVRRLVAKADALRSVSEAGPVIEAGPVEVQAGTLIRTARAGAKRRSTYRVEKVDSARGLFLREIWRSGGVWVESKTGAWSRIGSEIEVLQEVAPRAGDPVDD